MKKQDAVLLVAFVFVIVIAIGVLVQFGQSNNEVIRTSGAQTPAQSAPLDLLPNAPIGSVEVANVETAHSTDLNSPAPRFEQPVLQPAEPLAVQSSNGFVRADGTRLTLNGETYKFVGVNFYGIASDDVFNCGGNPDNFDEHLETTFSQLEQMKVNVVRFWAFQSFAKGGGDFTALDKVIAAAKRHNVKLIPTLENQWRDCTQGDFKYNTWFQNTSARYGSYPLTFKQYVERIVNRYKDEGAILMWQLMNEAESKDTEGHSDAQALYNFAVEISVVVKNIDSNHLVNLGTLGTGQAGTNDQAFINLHSISTIDVVEAHDYHNENEALPGFPWDGNVDELDTIAADLETSKQLNKPFFIGEAGISDSYANQVDLFKAKMDAAFTNGASGYLIWNFETSECSGYCFNANDPLANIFQDYV